MKGLHRLGKIAIAGLACSLLPLTFATAPVASRAPRALSNGVSLFQSKGCYECHGHAGQGAIGVAPAIARTRLPLSAFAAYVRRPSGQMPPYSARLLSDSEVAALYAYLNGLPVGPHARDIRMLAPYLRQDRTPNMTEVAKTAAAADPQTVSLYRRHCAGCHGSELEGGVGPSLRNEATKHSLQEIESIIRNPPAAMPRLFPAVLSPADVTSLATYVHEAAFARETKPR